MKNRTIAALLAVGALAAAALTGCDSMLESIFPEETNHNNSITVTVQTDYASVGLDIKQGPLRLILKKDGYTYATETRDLAYAGSNPITATFPFTNLPKGTYTAYAWIDYNDDGTTYGDYDYGYYWPGVQADGVSAYAYLDGGVPGALTEWVYYFGYESKYVAP
jgi:hypothetical protein